MIKIRFLIITVAVIGLMHSGCGRKQSSRPAIEEAKKQISTPEVKKISIEERIKKIISERNLPADTYGKSDPFAPIGLRTVTAVGRKTAELRLEGIITDPIQPLAIIGDSIVKVGDTIGDKKVIKINTDSVTLEDAHGEEHILRLF